MKRANSSERDCLGNIGPSCRVATTLPSMRSSACIADVILLLGFVSCRTTGGVGLSGRGAASFITPKYRILGTGIDEPCGVLPPPVVVVPPVGFPLPSVVVVPPVGFVLPPVVIVPPVGLVLPPAGFEVPVFGSGAAGEPVPVLLPGGGTNPALGSAGGGGGIDGGTKLELSGAKLDCPGGAKALEPPPPACKRLARDVVN